MKDAIEIATAPLDDTCKAILAKFKEQGQVAADVTYYTDESIVPVSDFHYLLKHGGIAQQTPRFSVRGVLKSFAVAKHGPDVGRVAFTLNFFLT